MGQYCIVLGDFLLATRPNLRSRSRVVNTRLFFVVVLELIFCSCIGSENLWLVSQALSQLCGEFIVPLFDHERWKCFLRAISIPRTGEKRLLKQMKAFSHSCRFVTNDFEV